MTYAIPIHAPMPRGEARWFENYSRSPGFAKPTLIISPLQARLFQRQLKTLKGLHGVRE